MTNPSTPDEPSGALWYEQADLAAIFIGEIAYGSYAQCPLTAQFFIYR